VTFLFLAKKKF